MSSGSCMIATSTYHRLNTSPLSAYLHFNPEFFLHFFCTCRYHGDIMNKSAYEMMKWIAVAKEEIPNIKVPFFCIHGGDDIIALPKGSLYLIENTGTIPSQKSVSILPGLKHEVFHEKMPDGPNSIQSVLTYFESFM